MCVSDDIVVYKHNYHWYQVSIIEIKGYYFQPEKLLNSLNS